MKGITFGTVQKMTIPRTIRKIVVHHTGFDAPFPSTNWVHIDQAHKRKGWIGIGYHFGVDPEGAIWVLRPPSVVGAHTAGHNADSLGLVIWGYKQKTEQAIQSLIKLTALLAKRFNAEVYFHRDLGKTLCPYLDGEKFRQGLLAEGVPENLIKIGGKK